MNIFTDKLDRNTLAFGLMAYKEPTFIDLRIGLGRWLTEIEIPISKQYHLDMQALLEDNTGLDTLEELTNWRSSAINESIEQERKRISDRLRPLISHDHPDQSCQEVDCMASAYLLALAIVNHGAEEGEQK